jgi:hypothetical protein
MRKNCCIRPNGLHLRPAILLLQFVAFSISVDCIAQTTTPSTVGPARTAAPPAPPSISQDVIISGNPSLIRLPDEWPLPWRAVASQVCATFRVSAAPSINSVLLYSTGLARSLLTEAAGGDCMAARNWRDRIALTKADPSTVIDRIIAVRIDSDPLLSPAASMEGHVIALVDDKIASEFTLKVERSPRAEAWTALTWVLTILVPAVVAFVATQATTKLNARWKENDEFRGYRFGQLQQLSDLIENDLHPIIEDSKIENRGKLIFDVLQSKKEMLSKIPERRVRILMQACIANDVRRITKILKRLFPETTQTL